MPTVIVQDDGKNNRQSFEARIELQTNATSTVAVIGFGATEKKALENVSKELRDLEIELHEESVEAVSEVKSRIANLT